MRIVAFMLFAVLVACTGSAASAPVPKHLMKQAEGDLAKLQGKWKIQSLKMGDMDLGGDIAKSIDMVMEFRGETITMTMTAPGANQKSTATLKLDANTKRMSVTNRQTVDGEGKPVQNPGTKDNETAGYAIDGDKLILVANQPGDGAAVDPRKPGPNAVVLTFVRIKE